MKQSLTVETDNGLFVNSTNSNEPVTPSNSTQNLSDDDDTIPVSFSSVLRYPVFRRYLLFFLLLFMAFYERAAFLSGYGAAYFGGCKTVKENNHCSKDFNYDKYNLLYQSSMSITSGFAFISAPIVGTLSDIYGRKPFLFIQIISYIIPYIFIIISNNIYIFLILFTIRGLNGSAQISTPVTQAYISDVLPQRLHIMGYSLMYLLSGFGLLLGEIGGYIISSLFNDHFNFYVVTGFYVICIIYLFVLIPESKKNNNNNNNDNNNNNMDKTSKRSYNPFSSFKYCCMNPIVFWVSLLSGLVALPAMGLVDIATIVLADNFSANSDKQFNKLALYYIVGWAVGLMFGPIFVLPILRKHFTEFNIFVVTIGILLSAIIIFMIICIFKTLWTVPVTSFILGIGFLCYAPLNSILTQYTSKDDRGIAFGPVFSFGAIMNIIAPILFAVSYHYLKKIHAPSLIFGLSFVMLIFALILSVGLKRAINKMEAGKNGHFIFVRLSI